ncbi:MAG: glycosyltransferase family 9 protein [Candidatus Sumerlaeota bacterium]|nr:glycosyltransferase family 9 protein [Candidatus Sumerlaeota bacterium]
MRIWGESLAGKEDLRILIVRLSALGDVIHTLPCLDALRRRFPKAHIGWVVEELSRELLDGHPQLDEVFVIPKKRWRNKFWQYFLPEIRPFYRRIRKRKFDVAIDFQGLTKSGLWAWVSGAKTRIGLGGEDCREINGWFTNIKVNPDTINPGRPIEHIIERNLSLLRPMGIEGQGSGIRGQGSGIRGQGSEAGEGGRQPLSDWSDRSDASDQSDPSDKPKTENRKPKTENRKPKTENRELAYRRALPDHAEWRAVIDGWLRHEGLPLDTRFIALNPGAGWETKRWPEERFAELGVWLVKEMRRNVLIMWGPPEETMARRIFELMAAQGATADSSVPSSPSPFKAVEGASAGSPASSALMIAGGDKAGLTAPSTPSAFMAPRLSVGLSVEMTRRCELFIGGDTGPTHLAAALDVPVVAIFGASDGRRNHPGGRRQVVLQKLEACPMAPCWKTRPPEGCQGLQCLQIIRVDDVMTAATSLLK